MVETRKAPTRLKKSFRTFLVCRVTVKFGAFRLFWPTWSSVWMPAVPRRFTHKLRFDALDPAHADLAFRRILGAVSPGALPDGLTPGDFALVRRVRRSCWPKRGRLF
jgi:hypothetical protein